MLLKAGSFGGRFFFEEALDVLTENGLEGGRRKILVLFEKLKEGFEIGDLLRGGKDPEGVVGAPEDFFVADDLCRESNRFEIVEERAGGGIVKHIAEGISDLRVKRVKRQETPEMGEDKGVTGVVRGQFGEGLEGGGLPTGVRMADRLGHMEVNRPIAGFRKFEEGLHAGRIEIMSLNGRKQFADSGKAHGFGLLQDKEDGFGGSGSVTGGKSMEPIGMIFEQLSRFLIMPATGFLALPIPAEENRLINAGCIHIAEDGLRVGPTLDGLMVERSDEVDPVGFAPLSCPCARIPAQLGGEEMGMGVNDHTGTSSTGTPGRDFSAMGGSGTKRSRCLSIFFRVCSEMHSETFPWQVPQMVVGCPREKSWVPEQSARIL